MEALAGQLLGTLAAKMSDPIPALISLFGGGGISSLRRPWWYVLILALAIAIPVQVIVTQRRQELGLPPFSALSFVMGIAAYTIWASIGFGIVKLIKGKAKAP